MTKVRHLFLLCIVTISNFEIEKLYFVKSITKIYQMFLSCKIITMSPAMKNTFFKKCILLIKTDSLNFYKHNKFKSFPCIPYEDK